MRPRAKACPGERVTGERSLSMAPLRPGAAPVSRNLRQVGQERFERDAVEAGEVQVDGFALQARAVARPKEMLTRTHHVVQEEEAIGFLEEQHLLLGQRIHL